MSNQMFLLTLLALCVFPDEKMNTINDLPNVNTQFEVVGSAVPMFELDDHPSCSADYTDCLDIDDVTLEKMNSLEKVALALTVENISLEEEQMIGKYYHEQANYTFINDKRTEKLNGILNKMRPYFLRQELDYKIYLIDDPVVNAWTIPGGYIYFTTGILEFAESDDELANIIGHEVGHNECKHTHKGLLREKGQETVTDLFEQFTGIKVDPQIPQTMMYYSTLPLIAFGQIDELQADRTGFYLANKIGYNPEKGLEFWKRSAKNETENYFDKFMRSHPYSSKRYECGEEYLRINKRN